MKYYQQQKHLQGVETYMREDFGSLPERIHIAISKDVLATLLPYCDQNSLQQKRLE